MKKIQLAFALVATAAAAAAPAPPDRAVATIDGVPAVTTSDLLYYHGRGLDADGVTPPDAAELRDLLDTLVDAAIITREAEAAGYAAEPAFLSQLEGNRRFRLRQEEWRLIRENVTVTDAETRAFFEKGLKRRMYSLIRAGDEATAAAVYAELQAGRPWEEVAADYGGGPWEVPMEYSGDAASEALFALDVGEYGRPVEVFKGLEWQIFRLDKIVHGSAKAYDESRADIETAIRQSKAERRAAEITGALRAAGAVTRDEALWRDILASSYEELGERYSGRNEAVSVAGGRPVLFDDVFPAVDNLIGLPPPEREKMRAERPARYEAYWERVVADLEDDALLEYRAELDGIADTPAFAPEMSSFRTNLLIDRIYQEGFLATLAEPTAAAIDAYFETHQSDFFTPARVEVYLAAMPSREELETFYAEINAGADLVITGEKRNRDKMLAEQALYEAPPAAKPAQNEWLGVVAIPETPPTDGEPEKPFVAELRARAFPFRELHVLSDVFELDDGRWAFYEPIYYAAAEQGALEDPRVRYYCRKALWEEMLTSPATDAAAAAWLAALRARHEVVIDEAAFEAAASLEVEDN